MIYEKQFDRYDSARIFNQKASVEFPGSKITKIARSRARHFKKYFAQIELISKIDDLLSIHRSDSAGVEIDSLRNQTALARYTLAWLFFMHFGRIDSAIYYLKDIINNFPSSRVAPQAYYLLANIYESVDSLKDKADEIYMKLIERFPNSTFANQARKILGLANEGDDDSLKIIYEKGISLIDSNPKEAVNILIHICNGNTNSIYKQKAYYAVGWICEYKLKDFKRALEFYKKLVEIYPNSIYADVVRNKISGEEFPKSRKTRKEARPERKFEKLEELIEREISEFKDDEFKKRRRKIRIKEEDEIDP
jgi:tetratricopeptide (TPR) repeat protein